VPSRLPQLSANPEMRGTMPGDIKITVERLEDQIRWYDGKSVKNQRWFKALRIAIIVAAALVPVVSFDGVPRYVAAALGALIVILEGVQQLNQFHAQWIGYRSTCESLKHEKFLYLARAAHYALATSPDQLLAERLESLVSQEHAQWATTQEQSARKLAPPTT